MKQKTIILIMVFSLLAGTACRKEKPAVSNASAKTVPYRDGFSAMKDVAVTIMLWDRDRAAADEDVAACQAETERLELILNRHRPEATLARVNLLPVGGVMEVEQELIDVLILSRKVHAATSGRFDPTVGPLIGLWKRAAEAGKIPDQKAIDAARQNVGLDSVILDGRKIRLKKKVMIDLGAIAKGYIVDRLAALLKQRGNLTGLVEAGGDIRVFGTKPGGFGVGIQDPRHPAGPGDPGQLITSVRVSSGSVVTSGSYQRYSLIEDREFSHIIDPVTGWPVENDLTSVSVFAPNAALADGLATGIFVLGAAKGQALLEADPDIGGLIINIDGEQWEEMPASQKVDGEE